MSTNQKSCNKYNQLSRNNYKSFIWWTCSIWKSLNHFQNLSNPSESFKSFKDFQSLSTCDHKKLQSFSSSVNNCLNCQSHKDKYYGLCALDILLQQCPSEYLEQNIGSYINSIVNQIFKNSYCELLTLNRACQVMAKIIDYGPSFPDASRQLSSLASTLIICITDLSKKHQGSQVGLLHCISVQKEILWS